MNVVDAGIEVSFSKVRIFLFLISFIAMFAYLIYFFYLKELVYQSFNHWLFIRVFVWVLTYYCSLSIVNYICFLLQTGPALIINNFGVYYKPNAFMSFQIPWSDISEIRTRQVKFTKYPMLRIEYYPQLFAHISFVSKLFFYPKLLFRPKSIVIQTPLMANSYKKIYNDLTFELSKNQPQDVLDMGGGY